MYADSIKQLVSEYSIETNDIMSLSLSAYTLKYNKVKDSNGNWVTSGGAYDDRWNNYNCYAYSIKRNELPQYYASNPIQYQPGDMADDYEDDLPKIGSILIDDKNNRYEFLTFSLKDWGVIMVKPLDKNVDIKEIKYLKASDD